MWYGACKTVIMSRMCHASELHTEHVSLLTPDAKLLVPAAAVTTVATLVVATLGAAVPGACQVLVLAALIS